MKFNHARDMDDRDPDIPKKKQMPREASAVQSSGARVLLNRQEFFDDVLG